MHLKEALQKKLAWDPYSNMQDINAARVSTGENRATLDDIRDVGKFAGVGAAGGTTLATVLTWALMKNPKALDYIRNAATGAVFGTAAGVGAKGAADRFSLG
jgi:hypothetical protein